MLEGCLLVLSVLFAFLAGGAYLEQRTRPESIEDGYSPSEGRLRWK